MSAVRSKPRFCNRAVGVQCRRARSLICRAGTGWQAYETLSHSRPRHVQCPARLGHSRYGCGRPRRANGDDSNGVASVGHRPVRHSSHRHRPGHDSRTDNHTGGQHAGPHNASGEHAVDHNRAGPDAARQDAGAGIALGDLIEHHAGGVVPGVRRHEHTVSNSLGGGRIRIGGSVVVTPGSVDRWARASLTRVRPGIEARNVSERLDG